MIIVSTKEGQLCNRLFHISHLIAFSVENEITVIYPFFSEYCSYYPNFSRQFLPKRFLYIDNSFVNFLLLRILPRLVANNKIQFPISIFADSEVNMDDESFILKTQNSLIFASGFLFRDYKNFQKYSALIKKIFSPKISDENYALNKINEIKGNGNSLVIGIHIRRGDYLTWQDGKHFYSFDYYSSVIKSIQFKLKKLNLDAKFIVFSNDIAVLNAPTLSELACHVACGDQFTDLALLMKCNYIFGPPSSYSAWASFMGNAPICFLEGGGTDYSIEMCKVYTG